MRKNTSHHLTCQARRVLLPLWLTKRSSIGPHAQALPGFWLRVAWLWQDSLPDPTHVPRQPCNLSDTEPAIAIVARNDADEQERVIPYDPASE